MKETINLMVIFICCAFTLVCIIGGGLVIIANLWERIADARRRAEATPRSGWQFAADIRSLDRWCCWHFPVIEDVCDWLMAEPRTRSIDEFRSHLIRKYGDRNAPNSDLQLTNSHIVMPVNAGDQAC